MLIAYLPLNDHHHSSHISSQYALTYHHCHLQWHNRAAIAWTVMPNIHHHDPFSTFVYLFRILNIRISFRIYVLRVRSFVLRWGRMRIIECWYIVWWVFRGVRLLFVLFVRASFSSSPFLHFWMEYLLGKIVMMTHGWDTRSALAYLRTCTYSFPYPLPHILILIILSFLLHRSSPSPP